MSNIYKVLKALSSDSGLQLSDGQTLQISNVLNANENIHINSQQLQIMKRALDIIERESQNIELQPQDLQFQNNVNILPHPRQVNDISHLLDRSDNFIPITSFQQSRRSKSISYNNILLNVSQSDPITSVSRFRPSSEQELTLQHVQRQEIARLQKSKRKYQVNKKSSYESVYSIKQQRLADMADSALQQAEQLYKNQIIKCKLNKSVFE